MENEASTIGSVALTKLIDEFKLVSIYAPENLESIKITRAEIHRPGLPLTGFFDYFDPERIQIFPLPKPVITAAERFLFFAGSSRLFFIRVDCDSCTNEIVL